jgi:hypothetical protein
MNIELGCSDGNCAFRHNTGMVTNGGCNCVRAQATHTGDGWTIPVQVVQRMVAVAARIAVDKNSQSDGDRTYIKEG